MNDMAKADLRERLGNIDQIRDILFGSYLRDFTSRLEQLESTFSILQQESRDRTEEVKQILTSELQGVVETLEKKIKALALKGEEEQLEIRQELEALSKRLTLATEEIQEELAVDFQDIAETVEKRLKALGVKDEEEKLEIRQSLDRLNKRVATQVQDLNEALDQQVGTLREDLLASREKFQEDVLGLRTQLFEELDRRLTALTDIKVSRDDMAELLFELGLRLKGTEFVPELRDAADISDAAAPPLREARNGDRNQLPHSHREDAAIEAGEMDEEEEEEGEEEEAVSRLTITSKAKSTKPETSKRLSTSTRSATRRRLRGR
ncbi:hypothetical protein [Trichothermofontia sp.]